jgi:hypothetical protein
MSDDELDRELAEMLARLHGRTVEEIETLLPIWQQDGMLAAIAAELQASTSGPADPS